MKVSMGRDVVTYEMSKWMQKLYGCTVQVGTGEKRCLVKDRVEIRSGETEKLKKIYTSANHNTKL